MKLANVLNFILIMGLAWSSIGCSYQWREADPGISSTELLEIIDDIQASGTTAGGDMSTFSSLVFEENTSTIFFAEGWADGSGTMGPPASVVSFFDFNFMGGQDFNEFDIDNVRAIFVDLPLGGGEHECALLIDIQLFDSSSFITRVWAGKGFIDDTKYQCELSGNLTVVSYDVDPFVSDELADVIQLNVYEDGQRIGKIATLVGFE